MSEPEEWDGQPTITGDQHHRAAEKTVLAPGAHVDDNGDYYEQSHALFADAVRRSLPMHSLFRRDTIPGTIEGTPGLREFAPLNKDSAQIFLDRHVRLIRWVKAARQKKNQETSHTPIYVNSTPHNAAIFLADAASTAHNISSITNYPVLTTDNQFSPPGYSNAHYYDEPDELQELIKEATVNVASGISTPDTIRTAIYELLKDFPFRSPADYTNFIGLLLTPLLRPAIDGPVPLHIVSAASPSTGKTTLVDTALGVTITGRRLSATQFSGNDDERDKRILSLLMSGQSIVHLDNLNDMLDSPILASLLTSSHYQGRVLGQSRMVSLPNNSIFVATGNNIQVSGEIARRCVPIVLLQTQERQEERTGFAHTPFLPWVRSSRRAILLPLYEAVILWQRLGCPRLAKPFASYEAWSEIISSILNVIGYSGHLSNAAEWRNNADDERDDLAALVQLWLRDYGGREVASSVLCALAKDNGLYPKLFGYAKSDRSAETTFGSQILRKADERVVGQHRIMHRKEHGNRRYRLDECSTYVVPAQNGTTDASSELI